MSIGGNLVNEELKRRAENLSRLLDEKLEIDADIKALKQAAKDDGYNMKAFAQIIKELRKGAEYQADQLQLELELDTYRRGVGLPVTLEGAQAAARGKAVSVPEPRSEKKKRNAPSGRLPAGESEGARKKGATVQ